MQRSNVSVFVKERGLLLEFCSGAVQTSFKIIVALIVHKHFKHCLIFAKFELAGLIDIED